MKTLALVCACVAAAIGCDTTEDQRSPEGDPPVGDESDGGAGGGVGGGSVTTSTTATGTGGKASGEGGAGGSASFQHCPGYAFLGSCQIPFMAQCREYYGNGQAGVDYLELVEPSCKGVEGTTWSSTEPCSLVGDIGSCDVPSPRVGWCLAQVDYPPEDPGALEPICVRKGGTFHPPEPP